MRIRARKKMAEMEEVERGVLEAVTKLGEVWGVEIDMRLVTILMEVRMKLGWGSVSGKALRNGATMRDI
jgi:hypothetical protein